MDEIKYRFSWLVFQYTITIFISLADYNKKILTAAQKQQRSAFLLEAPGTKRKESLPFFSCLQPLTASGTKSKALKERNDNFRCSPL